MSLRTIQRVEQGETVPRGYTMQASGPTKLPATPDAPFIGSLGTDVTDGRALTIDYARLRPTLSNTALSRLRAHKLPISFNERRVLLSVGIRG